MSAKHKEKVRCWAQSQIDGFLASGRLCSYVQDAIAQHAEYRKALYDILDQQKLVCWKKFTVWECVRICAEHERLLLGKRVPNTFFQPGQGNDRWNQEFHWVYKCPVSKETCSFAMDDGDCYRRKVRSKVTRVALFLDRDSYSNWNTTQWRKHFGLG